MCLIAFLPMATSVPGTHLAKISTASSGLLRVKYDDCASPAAMLLITAGFASTVGPCATATIT